MKNGSTYVNLNPSSPMIRGLIKIHKADSPIWPIINWKEAPAYKIAGMLVKNLETFIPLPYTVNVKNSIQLLNDLRDMPFDKDLQFVSFDITNMYTNIPTAELIKIIEVMYRQSDLGKIIRSEIIKMCNILGKQNYFQHTDSQYILWEPLRRLSFRDIFTISRKYKYIWHPNKLPDSRIFQICGWHPNSIQRK